MTRNLLTNLTSHSRDLEILLILFKRATDDVKRGPRIKTTFPLICIITQAPVGVNISFFWLSQIFGGLNHISSLFIKVTGPKSGPCRLKIQPMCIHMYDSIGAGQSLQTGAGPSLLSSLQ